MTIVVTVILPWQYHHTYQNVSGNRISSTRMHKRINSGFEFLWILLTKLTARRQHTHTQHSLFMYYILMVEDLGKLHLSLEGYIQLTVNILNLVAFDPLKQLLDLSDTGHLHSGCMARNSQVYRGNTCVCKQTEARHYFKPQLWSLNF